MYLRLRQQPATALGDIKNLSKIIEKSSKNLSKIYQNRSKINQKSIKISSWAPRGPKTPPRPSKPENRDQWTPPLGHPFRKLFRPCWLPKATKRPLKKHTKFSLIWKSIFHRFSSILAGFWKDLGAKLASKIH